MAMDPVPVPPAADAAEPIIRLEDVHKSFGSNHVLRGVDLAVPRGQTTVIMGASGSGKSVTLKLMIGLLRPDRGAVRYERTRLDELDESALTAVRREFGFLFQMSALFDSMTVAENVEFPLVEHTTLGRAERRARVERVLGMVRVAETAPSMPATLSGGQRKRVALARAIVLEPKVILYDEPTTGLDPIRADVINDLIIQLKEELGVTSVVVTHDLHSAFRIADRMVMLYDGAVIEAGTPEQMRTAADPRVRRFVTRERSDDPDLAETGAA